MSERGVFAVDRGIWDHPMFGSREPFTKREAWLWLLSEAAWRKKVVFVDGKRVVLERGQLAHSVRFIAEKWGWPKTNVARFLDTLKTETMIGTETGRSITIITIAKYSEYQRVSLPDRDDSGTVSGTRVGHERDKEEDIKSIELGDGDSTREGLISREAVRVADAIAEICGVKLGLDTPPGWCGAAMRVQSWIGHGWPQEIILVACREAFAKKRDGPPDTVNYFEKAIARAVANHAKPLPVVTMDQTPEVIHGQRQSASRPAGFGALAVRAAARRSGGDPSSNLN